MPNDNGRTLVIWFKNAETAYFSGVTGFSQGTIEIGFSYFGKETQVQRNAIFNRETIAGYALEVDDGE